MSIFNYPAIPHSCPGKLIAFDGLGGVGKDTQADLLEERLELEGYRFKRYNLPRYQTPIGQVIRNYLDNVYGDASVTDPYVASIPYALDRKDLNGEINYHLSGGTVVILVRCFMSNLIYQGAKLPPGEREKFCEWLVELEFGQYGLTREDKGILLSSNPSICHALATGRKLTSGLQSDGIDGHEGDERRVSEMDRFYVDVVNQLDHWEIVSCLDDTGNLLAPQQISNKVWTIIQAVLTT